MIFALAAFALVFVVCPALLLLAADVPVDVPPDLLVMLQDALGMHSTLGYVLAGVIAVLVLLPIILKALGKSVPLLDPLLKIASAIVSRLVKGKTVVEPPKAEVEKQPGASNVVELKDWPEDKK